jgi:hypothetical protein
MLTDFKNSIVILILFRFTDDSVVDSIQLGELIRRHVWNNPLHFLCDNMKENSDDEDDEVDSKEEEEEDEDDEEEA